MSSSDRKRLQRRLKQTQKAAEKLGVSEKRARKSTATAAAIKDRLGINIVILGVLIAAIWGLTALLGVQINLLGVVVLFGAGIAVSLATNRTGAFGFGFWIITLGIAGVLIDQFAPAAIVSLFDPVTAYARTNIPGVKALLALPSGQLLAFGIAVVTVYWLLDIRVLTAIYRTSGQASATNPDTVARRLASRYEDLIEDYVGVLVAVGAFGLAAVGIVLSGVGDFGAEAFELLAEAPVLGAALGSDLIAFKALGGSVPYLEGVPVISLILDFFAGMGAVDFAILAGFLLMLAVFATEDRD